MYREIGSPIELLPLRKILLVLVLLSMSGAIVILASHELALNRHVLAVSIILFFDFLVLFLRWRGHIYSGVQVFLILHFLAFLLPVYMGYGRIANLIILPVMLCWLVMGTTNKYYVAFGSAFLTISGAVAVFLLRDSIEMARIELSFVVEGTISVIVMSVVFLTAYYFFKSLDSFKNIKTQNDMLVRKKSRDLEKHIRTHLQLENFAHSAAISMQQPISEVTALNTKFTESAWGKLDEEERQYFNFIIAETEQINALTKGLLALSKLTNTPVQKRSVNTKKMLERLLDQHFLDYENTIFLGQMPAQINANPDEIQTVLKNLIDNAIKYATDDRPLRIIITGEETIDDYTFYVKDNGVGISDEQKENTFLLFKRLQADGQGTGIGLPTCKRIVERHGGTISIKDNPEGGSIFIFTLAK